MDLQGGGPLSYASRPLGPTSGSRTSLDTADNEKTSRCVGCTRRGVVVVGGTLCRMPHGIKPTASSSHRIIIVSNQLPIKAKRTSDGSWNFEWDEWALMKQAGVCCVFGMAETNRNEWCPVGSILLYISTITTTITTNPRCYMQDGISSSTMKVVYVGCLAADVPHDEEEVGVYLYCVCCAYRCGTMSMGTQHINVHSHSTVLFMHISLQYTACDKDIIIRV